MSAGLPSPHPYRWVLMGGLVACSWGVLWYGFTLGVLLPDMRDDLELNSAQQGWLSSSFFLGQVLFALPATALLSRFSPLPAMGVMFAAGAVVMGLAFLLPTYWLQLVLRLGVSLVFVAITPIRTMVLAGWFGRSEIARANGIFNSGFGAVQTAGLWVSGALLEVVGGWREMLLVFCALSAAGAAAWIVIAGFAPPPLAPVRAAGARTGGRSWLRVARHREVLALSLIGVGGASTWAVFLTFWPAVARDSLGLRGAQSGLVLGCTAVAIIPGSLLAATVVRRLGGRMPFLLIATLVQVPTFAFFVLTGDVALLIAIGLLQGLTWMYFPILLSVPFQIQGFDEQDVALATAVFVVANGLALALGPSVAGLLGTFVPIRTVLLAFAVAPLLSTLGALLLGRESPGLVGLPAESTA